MKIKIIKKELGREKMEYKLVKIKMHWNNFLSLCCKQYPKESCAMLYSKRPFSRQEEWFVFPIRNVHENPEEGWIPDKKELAKLKKETEKLDLVKIGNVHRHPLPRKEEFGDYIVGNKRLIDFYDEVDMWEEFGSPSEIDLKYARKFNDIIRGILVVDDLGVYHSVWHDKFGNKIKLYFDEEIGGKF